ncbi:hypothetical protein F5B22DRAFT_648839 [Xylaria bambusicola]|uniref:uncharacterized protein n=1 Tax=Xylaria bambusicola TaxID=326684 RepID=UPI002008D213|nr:uncharacterized protein F5B22DRAFT_648839 [Xylaria bambusicola]KAI0509605.1 hypothetical protein F5B22DRAFT_648839 [Xylaria bambusicola]
MFFQGSLQDGISTALQQSKQVVCLVTDDGVESQQWENEFLADDSIRPGLESSSVVLRLLAGSEEAGYLEALFPVPKKPTVVVIQNGQLKEYIAAGTSKEEFIRRLGKSTPSSTTQQSQASSAPTAAPAQSRQSAPPQLSHTTDSLYDDDIQPAISSTTSSAPPQGTQPSAASEEEEEEEEEKRFTAEQKGKARAEAEDEARRRVNERCGSEPPNAEQAHANEIKLRKQQANEERKRILKRIEDDKRARKEREAAERRARQQLSSNANAEEESNGAGSSIPLRERLPKAGQGDHCNLQVRLLDGSTIRTRFASDKTLSAEVRKWVDEERTDGDAPYSFRVVLTPLPNKVIEAQEESKSLLSLGLVPSATMVLVPKPYSAAYARTGVFSPVFGVFSMLYGGVLASLAGIFSLFFGGGGSAGQNSDNDVPMENLRARRRDPQFYNGNSLSFEPRTEDDDEHNSR